LTGARPTVLEIAKPHGSRYARSAVVTRSFERFAVHCMKVVPVVTAMLSLATSASGRAADPLPEPLPTGLWELAATLKAPFEMRTLEPLAGVLVMSDLTGSVAAIRPDSGLVAWTRKVPAIETLSGVWPLATAEGGIVLAAGDSLQAFRADVGSRLWERDLGCQLNGCQTRVVHASVREGGRDAMLFLAAGGIVQSELVRLDPTSGAPLWRRAATVAHPKRVLASRDLLVSEDSLEPYLVRFFDPADGRVLGTWQPGLPDAPKPASDLMLLPDGRTIAVDLRPSDGLALVTVISSTGNEITERQLKRPAQLMNVAVMAGRVDDGLAIFTPDPSNGVAYVTTMLLEEPWTARTEQVRSFAEPLRLAGRWAFAPSVRAPAATWSTTGTGRWAREVVGIDASPTRTRSFAAGGRLTLVDLGDAKTKTQALATLDASGMLHGFGAPELGPGTLDRALAIGDELILTRGKQLFRMVLVPWADAVTKLRAARGQGADVSPFLQRLARFGAPAKALSDAVRGSGGNVTPAPEPPPSDSSGPVPLTPEDAALVTALREAWLASSANPTDTLQGMLALVEEAPERSARRHALLEAFSTLLLDLVLAPGVVARGEEIAPTLSALARTFEWEAQTRPPSRAAVAIYAALMALIDESLAGADVLSRASGDSLVNEARLELARRALYTLHKSAGPLKTDTSRSMLVSGLRFFRHLELLVGSDFAAVNELLDKVAAQDGDATRALEAVLVQAEGPNASRKGAGPALCQLACEATLAVCGEGVAGAVVGCQARCEKSGAVRFSALARASIDQRWFCH